MVPAFINKNKHWIIVGLVVILAIWGYRSFLSSKHQLAVLKKVIERLEADSRVAEVLVTGVNYDEEKKKNLTTIKFLEYDAKGAALEPKYYTFAGNIIQFQTLVIRFDDIHIRRGDALKGKSAYLFWKIFMLDGPNTQEYPITSVNEIPDGYRLAEAKDMYEQKLWQKFWAYALQDDKRREQGIKNVQIEAPGTIFIPGYFYTIKIEHDGGLRIDSKALPQILRGETIPK